MLQKENLLYKIIYLFKLPERGWIYFKNLANNIYLQICLFYIKYQIFASKKIQDLIDFGYICQF